MLVLLLTLPVTSTISQGPPAPGQPCALWGPRHTAGGGGASEHSAICCSVLTHPARRWENVFQETGPWCQKGTADFTFLSPCVFICKLEIVTPTVPHTQISEIFGKELEIGVQR